MEAIYLIFVIYIFPTHMRTYMQTSTHTHTHSHIHTQTALPQGLTVISHFTKERV